MPLTNELTMSSDLKETPNDASAEEEEVAESVKGRSK
jgi:hypothetical protein